MNEALAPIHVRLKLGDYYLLNFLSWRRWLRLVLFIGLLFIGLELFIAMTDELPMRDWLSALDPTLGIVLLGTVLALLFIVPPFQYWSQRKMMAKGYAITLSSAGVATELEHQRGTVDWPLIKRVICARGRLFLFISDCSAFIIPRRAMQSDADFARYEAASRAWHDAAASKGQA